MSTINERTTSNHHTASSDPKQSSEPTANDDIRTHLYEMITEALGKFVFTTIPEGLYYIRCHITRAKDNIYWLHAERPTDKEKVSDNEAKQIETDRFSFFSEFSQTTS